MFDGKDLTEKLNFQLQHEIYFWNSANLTTKNVIFIKTRTLPKLHTLVHETRGLVFWQIFFFLPLRGQIVHWIGAQFCVCMFLDSIDKSLNMLKICRNDQRKWKNKRRTKGASLLRNPLTMHKMHSLAS